MDKQKPWDDQMHAAFMQRHGVTDAQVKQAGAYIKRWSEAGHEGRKQMKKEERGPQKQDDKKIIGLPEDGRQRERVREEREQRERDR